MECAPIACRNITQMQKRKYDADSMAEEFSRYHDLSCVVLYVLLEDRLSELCTRNDRSGCA